MKKLYLGIFACCFTIAMNSAESKSGATPAQQAAAIKIQSGQVTAATPEHQRVITSLSKALESRGALGTQTVCSPEDSPTTAAFHGTARKAPSAKESAAFSLAASGEPVHRGSVDLDAVPDRDEDDRESIGGDSVAGGYDSEGTTFEDDKHIDPLEYLCASRLVGGFAMTKLDAWDAVRNRQEFKVSTGLTSSTTKRAKCRNTSNFVIQLIPDS